MKPNFALTLSFEGIGLLHRAFPGWHMVGEVSLASPDLAAALAGLRDRAAQLDAGPIRTKLVIPNDQIRYLQFGSEGYEADEIADAVHRTLQGATPYAVADLAYDWSIGAGQVHVAAVARETLAEAEAFASEHGFGPLCFVAVPEGRDFIGEPWFGDTRAAADILSSDQRIDRDTAAIRVIGTAPAPVSTAARPPDPGVPPTPEPDIPPAPQPEPEPDIPPEPSTPPVPEPEVPPRPDTPPAPEVPEVPPAPEPDIPPEPRPEPGPDLPPQPAMDKARPSPPAPTFLPRRDAPASGSASFLPPPGAAPGFGAARPRSDDTQDARAQDIAAQDDTPDDTSTPAPAPAGRDISADRAPAVSFSSIRARRDSLPSAPRPLTGATRSTSAPEAAPTSAGVTRPVEPPLTASAPAPRDAAKGVTGTPQDALPKEAAARIGATLRPTEADRMGPPAEHGDRDTNQPAPADDMTWDVGDDDTGDIPPPPAFMAERSETPPDPSPDTPPLAATPADIRGPDTSGARLAAEPSFTSRRQGLLPGKDRSGLRSAARPTPGTEREKEKQRLTIFGARKPASVGGKPRFLGLILTAVLLLFLVGVAAWASIFLEDGLAHVLRGGQDPDAEQTASTPEAEIAPDAVAVPETSSAPQTGTTGDEDVIAALPGVTSDADDAPARALPEPNPAEPTDQQARSRYAVTGIWQRAPDAPDAPSAQTLDEFYLTSIDPKVLEQDAVALPAPDTLRGDTRPDTPASPPAADTMFTMDTRGLVQPTRDGALTPDGVRVYAGQPALVPPERPAETMAQPGEDPADAAARIAAAERLAGFRPRTRPGDLSETNQRETLGGRTRDELATLRPRLRPQSAQELAAEAAAEAAAETAAVPEDISPDPSAVTAALQAAADVPAPDPFAGATAQAVSVSAKPNARPRNFARIVQRSQRLAEQQEARTAAVAVPSNQRVSPSGPTPTTVARAATEQNAIKLRRVNLIGVYGSNSNRRALVRLANGRYQKVKVGDRLDGGRVAAIGTSELRYVKSGRSVTLTMPRG